jgi:hypothetical protein
MKKTVLISLLLISLQVLNGQSLSDSLIAHYKYAKNARNAVGVNDGLVTGAKLAKDRNGIDSQCYYFDRNASTNINFGRSSDFEMGTRDFSISVWFKHVNANSSWGYVIGKRGWNSGLSKDKVYGLIISPQSKLMFYYRFDDHSQLGLPLSAVLDTNWHHAVATIDRSDSIKLYIDKKLVAGTNISGNSNTFNAPGGDLMSGNCTHINEPFKGYIDDIRIYKGRALSAKTVCDLYDLTITSLEKVSNKKAISIYPNPISDILMVKVRSRESGFNYSLYDLNGRVLINGAAEGHLAQLDLSDLANGVYMLCARNSDGVIIDKQKVTKN